MGLFDFFKRRSREPSTSNEPATPEGFSLPPKDEGPSFRYVLAHVALRQIALANPLQVLATAASPESQRFLPSIVNLVRENEGLEPDFAPTSLEMHPTRVAGYPCAVMTMPEPQETTDAFYTAVVALAPIAEGLPEDLDSVAARYFTLEKGPDFDGVDRTILCEWTESSHLNFGEGPEPSLEGFVERIAELFGDRE